jgi:Chromosome segregation ATPases
VLVVVCLGLGIGLVSVRKQADKQQHSDSEKIDTLSNKWVKVSGDLDEQRQVAAMLEKDLDAQKKSYGDLTNNYTQVTANLVKTEGELRATEAEIKKRDARINELESANQVLDKQASDLSTSLTNLTAQIDDTRKKLAASEGDKAFLEGELKRLMAEKAELERQFNDLTVLRAQVSKLKEELSIARRLDWIRQGLFAASEQKGAQKLMQGVNSPSLQAKTAKPNYDLNVEVSSDGSVKVIPPRTNTPPANAPQPPK